MPVIESLSMSNVEATRGIGREWIHGHVKPNERIWDQAPEVLSESGLKDAGVFVKTLRDRGWDACLLKQREGNPSDESKPLIPIGVHFYENGEENPGRRLYMGIRKGRNGVSVAVNSLGGFNNFAGRLIPPFEDVTEIGIDEDTITISQMNNEITRALVFGPGGSVSYTFSVNIAAQPLEQG